MRTFLRAPLRFLTILLFLCEISEAIKVAKFHDAASRFNNSFFSNFTLYTKNDSLYLDATSVQALKMGVKGQLEIQLRLSDSKVYQTIFSTTLDVCNVMISFKESLFKKLFLSVLKFGNMQQSCPIPSGHYYINDWKLDSELIPIFLYPGDYLLKGYIFMGKYTSKSKIFIGDAQVSTLIIEV